MAIAVTGVRRYKSDLPFNPLDGARYYLTATESYVIWSEAHWTWLPFTIKDAKQLEFFDEAWA